MYEQQEAEIWYGEVEEKLKEVNNEKDFLTKKEEVLNMKINLVSRIKDKLKSDLLNTLKEELKETELQTDQLTDVGNDLALLRAHIAARYNLR